MNRCRDKRLSIESAAVALLFFLGFFSRPAVANVTSPEDRQLDAWVHDIQRDGFVLLKKVHQNGILFAIFWAGRGKIAVCDRSDQPVFNGQSSLDILGPRRQSMFDPDKKREPLTRHTTRLVPGGISWGEVHDGDCYALQSYQGPIMVQFFYSWTFKDGSKHVGDVTVPMEWKPDCYQKADPR